MALRITYSFKHNGVQIRNFLCYKFRYLNYENDPNPHLLALYRIKGVHPTSGNMWNLLQGINLNYVPRGQRRAFVKDALDTLNRSKLDFKFSWHVLMMKYPFLSIATRRYYLQPTSYIQNLEYIPPEKMEEELIRNLHRDYSFVKMRSIAKKYRQSHPKPGKRK